MPTYFTRRNFLKTLLAGATVGLTACKKTYPNRIDSTDLSGYLPPQPNYSITLLTPTVKLSDYGDLKMAVAALPVEGGAIAIDQTVFISETIDLPPGVSLIGTTAFPGNNSDKGNMGDTQLNQPHLLVARGVSPALRIHGGSGIVGVFLHKEAVFFGGSDASAFLDHAIHLVGEDAYVLNCFITGFEQAIYGSFIQRSRVVGNKIDCIAGVWLDRVFDIAHIHQNHVWPWVTVSVGTPASARRLGAAFRFTNGGDWNQLSNNFSFGHRQGFVMDSVEHMTLIQCGADSYGSDRHGTGFTISGSSKNIAFVTCQAGGQDVGFLSTTGRTDKPNQLLGCSHWSNNHDVIGW